jgi:DNA mismatch repair protein MutS2
MLPEQSRTFDALVRKLEAQYEALEEERRVAASERFRAEQLRARAEEALEAIRKRDKQKLSEEAERLLASLREARAELKEARRALRRAERHDEESLAKIRAELDRVDARVGELVGPREEEVAPPAPGETLDEREIAVGQRVYVPRLRAEVDVVEAPSKGRVRVAAGPVKLWVKVDELRKVGGGAIRTDGRRESAVAAPSPTASTPTPEAAARPEPPPTDRNTIDVRGMRVDDAIAMTESFLDRMFGSSEPVAYVLHGVGSGALRDAIRDHLSRISQYVARSRPGTLEEGGERMTVVYLR